MGTLEFRKMCKTLETERQVERGEKETLEREVEAVKLELGQTQEDFEQAKREKDEVAGAIETLKDKCYAADDVIEKLEKDRGDFEKTIETLEIEMEKTKDALALKSSESEDLLQKMKESLDAEVSSLKDENAQKENEIIEMGEKLQEAFSDYDKLRKENDKVEQLLKEKEMEVKTCQSEYETEKRDKEVVIAKHSETLSIVN